jgi:hypothetical protein
VIDLSSFETKTLVGGFVLSDVRLSNKRMVDAIGREAVAQTSVNGNFFHIVVWAGLDEHELSVTLYHETLEAAAVASASPPASVIEFNEGDFERAAHEMHARFGPVTPEKLSQMLRYFGFSGE